MDKTICDCFPFFNTYKQFGRHLKPIYAFSTAQTRLGNGLIHIYFTPFVQKSSSAFCLAMYSSYAALALAAAAWLA